MPSIPPESRRLRADLAQLTDLALGDLGIVWRRLNTADEAKAALRDIVPQLVTLYGSAAGTLAADWYDDLREEKGIGRRFRAIVSEIPDPGAEALAGYAVSPLYQATSDWGAAETLAGGGIQRRIANVARSTITGSSIQDPGAQGWVRVGEGACKSGWCDQYLDGVVRFVEGYDFKAHDWCRCSAAPAFGA